MNRNIELSELIEQVRSELLASPREYSSSNNAPFLFVESVELELQVTLKRDGKAGIKIDVLSIGGGELGGVVAQDKAQKIKVKLSPLFNKDEIRDFYQTFHPDDRLNLAKQSLNTLKGNNQGSAEDTVE